MKKSITSLLLCTFLLLGSLTLFSQSASDAPYWNGRLFFKLKDDSNIRIPSYKEGDQTKGFPIFEELLSEYQISEIFRPFELLKTRTFINTYEIRFDESISNSQLIQKIKTIPEIEYVEQVPIDRLAFDPNDAYENSGDQWYLEQLQAYQAWDIGTGSSNVVIAIIDDAVKADHEDLAPAMWNNPGEILNGIDDDGNGYIDDITGYDLADNDNNTNPPASANYSVFSHGTHVAGIAGAATNNSIGVASIAGGVKIMGIKCNRNNTTNTSLIEYGWLGVQYAIASGADIMNVSWGGTGYSITYENMINYAEAQGILMVAAAGNNNSSTAFYPAAYSNVIGVASLRTNSTKSSFSNYGSWVNVAAPGSSIMSTVADPSYKYFFKGGTSMASPVVASVCGLALSQNPSLSPSDLRNCISSGSENINSENPTYVGMLGAGRVNALNAVQCSAPASCITPFDLQSSNSGSNATFSWSSAGSATNYTVRIRPAGGTWQTFNSSSTNYTYSSMSSCQDYEFQVRTNCSDGSASNYTSTVGFTGPSQGPSGYCDSYATDNFSTEYINSIVVGGLNNISGNDNGYGDYTCTTTNLTVGNPISISLSPGFASGTFPEYWRIFIDYNQDGDFNDSNEIAFDSGSSSISTVNGTISIPNSATPGITRMRVSMKWYNSADLVEPCEILSYGEVEDYIVNIVGTVTNCGTVAGISTSTISTNSASLSWSSIPSATGYTVEYKPTGSSSWIVQSETFPFSQLNGLNAATDYQVRVKANCSTSYSNIFSFTTENEIVPCLVPTGLTSANITTNSAKLNWTNSVSADSYQIRYRIQGGTWSSAITAVNTSYTISGLTSGTNYEGQVRSVCGTDESSYSSSHTFTTDSEPCNAPNGVTANVTGTSSANISWNSASFAEDYNLQYRKDGTSSWSTIVVSSTSQLLTDLDEETAYDFRLRTNCSSESSTYTGISTFETEAIPCTPPSALNASSIDIYSATLDWNTTIVADSYTLQYRLEGSSSWSSKTAFTNSYTLETLVAESLYEARIRSYCGNSNYSNYSSIINFSTSAEPCIIPTDLTANSITETSALLQWSANSNADQYIIRYRKTSAAAWNQTTSTVNNASLDDLESGTEYEFQVKAECGSGNNSNYTNSTSFTTETPFVCNVPSGFSFSNLETNSADVSWSSIPEALEFTVRYREVGFAAWSSQSVSNNSIVLSSLSSNTTYEVRTRTICDGGNSAYSAIETFTTDSEPIVEPSDCIPAIGLTASAIGQNQATLNWAEFPGAISYTIKYKKTGSYSWSVKLTSENSYLLTGLIENTEYDFKVRTKCSANENSDYSAVASFSTTEDNTCHIPTNLNAVATSSSSANISFDGSTNADSYVIRYRIEGSPWQFVNTSTTEYSLTGLSSCTSYQYHVKSECGSNNSVFSGLKSFVTSGCQGNSNSYCIAQGDNANYEWIAGVSINTIQNNTSSDGGYGDYTSISTELGLATTYPIQLTPGYANAAYQEYWRVWIDFNQDGDFDDNGELAYDPSALNTSTVNGNITVPSNASLGSTRMRIAMRYKNPSEACESFNYGEVEDYTVVITEDGESPEPNLSYCNSQGYNANYEWIANVSINDLDNSSTSDDGYGDYTSVSTTIETGSSHYIYLSPGFANTLYNEYWKVWIDYNQDGNFNDSEELVYDAGTTNNSQVSGIITVPTDALEGTTRMRVSMRYNGPASACESFSYGEVEDYTIVIEAGDGESTPLLSYCESYGTNTNYEWINTVQFLSIDNTSGANGGYGNFLNLSADVSLGESFDISLSPGYANNPYNEYWMVWIDYDQSGTFDSNEVAFDPGNNSPSTVTGTINIPSNANLGTTRMRIAMKYKYPADPCEIYTYGEVEDYTIVIGETMGLASVDEEQTAEDNTPVIANRVAESSSTDNCADKEYSIAFDYEAENLNVKFNNFSKGEFDSYFWSFGDGEVSSMENPTHKYKEEGDYYFNFSISDSKTGCSKSFEGYVHVFDKKAFINSLTED